MCVVLALIYFEHRSWSFPSVGNVMNPKVWLRGEPPNDVALWRKCLLNTKVKNYLVCIGGGRRQALTVFLA